MSSINRIRLGILLYIFFMRLVESQSLTIMCRGKDKRSRFVAEAKREGLIKEVTVRKRERTTHQMTLYAITKKGIRCLKENMPGSFLENLSESELRSLAIFDKDEYNVESRKRIADISSAMIMAMEMGGRIPAGVINRHYAFGEDSSSNNCIPRTETYKTLSEFIGACFSEEEYRKLGFFCSNESNDNQICFYDAAYVKQAVSYTNDPKTARDYYKGREIGLFMSPKQSLLVYYAPFFGMSWSRWQTKPELDALSIWNHRYAPQEIRYSRQLSALLVVKNPTQFANLYNDVDHACKDEEVFGDRFDHVYLAEQTAYGAELLRWLMSYSDEEIDENCTELLLSKRLATRNHRPSKDLFLYRDLDGREAMCGFHIARRGCSAYSPERALSFP